MKEHEESNMKRFMRPHIRAGVALLGAAITIAPATALAQAMRIAQIAEEPNPLLLHSTSQGYLGVLVSDVDSDSATKLKLKDVRGVLVTLIDHDAPAAQVGLHVNDVLLEVNGQGIENAEAFGRMMRDIPPGRKITMLVSRDGATQTLTVQLVDHKKLDSEAWNKLNSGSDISAPVEGLAILGTGAAGDAPLPGGFHMPFVGNSTLKVGAMVEPLTTQMADYLGVQNGLMVKQVARKSEAAAAGMKAFDVILKVGPDNIATVSDWERSLRANQGKAVQITILRERKQQTLSLQVDSKKKSDLEFEEIFPESDGPLMALVDPDAAGTFAFEFSPQQAEEFRKQAEQFRDAFKDRNFGIDQKQLDQMQEQMKEFHQNFKPEDLENFKFDGKQMDEFKKMMQDSSEFQFPAFSERQREEMKRQMDELKRQMKAMQPLAFGHLV